MDIAVSHPNMSGLLFVTAELDHKQLNTILLYLRDWEYGSGDRFTLITTRNAAAVISEVKEVKETSPPVPEDLSNEWIGSTLNEIESFVLDLSRNSDGYIGGQFVVIDEEGLPSKTCILGDRVYDDEADPPARTDKFNKMRLPWDEAYIIWCNLELANMGFEEFTDEDGDENGWYAFRSINDGPALSEENEKKRNDDIARIGGEF